MKTKMCWRCEAYPCEAYPCEASERSEICRSCYYELENIGTSKEEESWQQKGFQIIKIKDRPVDPIFTDSDYSVVRQAICALPKIEREVIFLRFWKRYDAIRIADELGIKIKNVKNHIDHAYARLRRICILHPKFSQNIFTGKTSFQLPV